MHIAALALVETAATPVVPTWIIVASIAFTALLIGGISFGIVWSTRRSKKKAAKQAAVHGGSGGVLDALANSGDSSGGFLSFIIDLEIFDALGEFFGGFLDGF
jgi:hypothetical protein